MKELINFLKGIPENNELGIKGFLGEELYSQKHKLNQISFFKNKNINILEKSDYPKKTQFFILKEQDKYLLSDNIYIFALYLIKNDKIVMNCSLDSFINYENYDSDFII